MKAIVGVPMEDVEDRSGTRLTAWRRGVPPEVRSVPSTDAAFRRSSAGQDLGTELFNLIGTAAESLLVACDHVDGQFGEALGVASGRGVRIYMLLGAGGFRRWVSHPLVPLADGCLCRRSDRPIPALVLADPHSASVSSRRGMLLAPGSPLHEEVLRGPGFWQLRLDAMQVNCMADLYSWFFWSAGGDGAETCSLESIKRPQSARLPRGAELKPFESNAIATVPAGSATARSLMTGLAEASEVSACGLSLGGIREVLGANAHSRLRDAVLPKCEDFPGKAQVVANETAAGAAYVIAGDADAGWLLDWIPNPEWHVRHSVMLALNKEQIAALKNDLTQLRLEASWVLHRDIPLGQFKDDEVVITGPGLAKVTIKAKVAMGMDNQIVDRWWDGNLSRFVPPREMRPKVTEIAKQVHWSWINDPVPVPAGAKKAPEENKVCDYLESAERAKQRIEGAFARVGASDNGVIKNLNATWKTFAWPIRTISDLNRIGQVLQDAATSAMEFCARLDEESELSGSRGGKGLRDLKLPDQNLLPSHDLPGSGELWRDGGNFFIVVDDWDQVERAAQDAERLSAELCVRRGDPHARKR